MILPNRPSGKQRSRTRGSQFPTTSSHTIGARSGQIAQNAQNSPCSGNKNSRTAISSTAGRYPLAYSATSPFPVLVSRLKTVLSNHCHIYIYLDSLASNNGIGNFYACFIATLLTGYPKWIFTSGANALKNARWCFT